MRQMLASLCFAAAFLLGVQPAAADLPTVRVAALKFGTVNWLMSTIEREGFDRAAGFDLEVVALASKPATSIAFQSGDVDLIVSDWVWAMRQTSVARLDLRFAPYSTALGALMTMPGRGVGDLCALEGRSIGVVGGENDKSWLVMQALARERCGFDLATSTQALFGAPPLMARQLETGGVDAVLNYWHYVARLEAAGAERVMGVADAMAALGIEPAPALVGFVWRSDELRPAERDAFLSAVRAASAHLAESDAAWEALRPDMKAGSEAAFLALRDAYRAGIPTLWTDADTAASQRLHSLLTGLGGSAYAREAGPFLSDVFHIEGRADDHGG